MIEEVLRNKIILKLLSSIPHSILKSISKTKLIIPYYHMISNENVPYVKHLYRYKNIKQFKDDLYFLLKKYKPISLIDLLNNLKKEKELPHNSFLLTFDDGFREMSEIVAPILIEKGIPAVFFVNSAFIDNRSMCFLNKESLLIDQLQKNKSIHIKSKINEILKKNKINSYDDSLGILSINYQKRNIVDQIANIIDLDFKKFLLKNKPYLTTEQIKKLLNNGFHIGSHSIDHPYYADLSFEDQLKQTIESIKVIKKNFQLNYSVFSFPLSDHNISLDFFDTLHKKGFLDISFGSSGLLKDSVIYNLQRINMEKSLMKAKDILTIQLYRKILKMMFGKDVIKRS